MWLWLTVFSAIFLGLNDVVKKYALRKNSIYWILLSASAFTVLFLSPFFSLGNWFGHSRLMLKAILVSASWITGLYAIKLLPITTVSTIKASRPVIVVIFCIILFGEKLNIYQWIGVVIVLSALYLLNRSSHKKEYSDDNRQGWLLMIISVLTGSASALYDKHIIADLEPIFIQIWANVYISCIMTICLIFSKFFSKTKETYQPLRPAWNLVLLGILITGADFLYFKALATDGAMLSIISLIRRFAVVVTFVVGAIYFKEHNLKDKIFILLLLISGLVILFTASQ